MPYQIKLYGTNTLVTSGTDSLTSLSLVTAASNLISATINCYKINPLWKSEAELNKGIGNSNVSNKLQYQTFNIDCEYFNISSTNQSIIDNIIQVLNRRNVFLEVKSYEFELHNPNKCFHVEYSDYNLETSPPYRHLQLQLITKKPLPYTA